MALSGPRPGWLTFDCYGTLAQWDEGLIGAVEKILAKQEAGAITPGTLIEVYDRHEHALEQARPFRTFRDVAGTALALVMDDLGLASDPADMEILTGGISAMPPFPEMPDLSGVPGLLQDAGWS